MCHSTFQEKLGSLGRLYNPHLQPQDDRVRFTSVSNCGPLAEHKFPYAIKDNYYSLKKFNFGLNQDQVAKLMTLFHSKKISKNPVRNVWRRGDKPKEGHARSGGDLKKVIVDRLRVMSKEDEHINLNEEKIVEVDKVSCGRKRDMFKKTHLRENDDFGDSGSWKNYQETTLIIL